jgi:hypothetical protein
MGSEWERKRAEGYKKRMDKRLIELGTPDLFTQQPERAPRVAAADILDGISISPKQLVVIQKIGDRLAVLSGLYEVGEIPNPHPEIVLAVGNSFGSAKGIVQVFHRDACTAEISIC